MGKKYLSAFFFICLVPCLSYSQLTITQADMPNAGDTLRISYSGDTVNPSVTGTNQTWDFSYLTPNAQWVRKFDSPTTFTFPFNAIFNPINTSFGEEQYAPDSIPFIGIKPDNVYGFFKKSSASFRQIGAGLTINSLPIPFVYNPMDTIYRFPINYGNSDSSNAKFGLQIPGLGYYGQKIHRVNYVDGWGTLMTPYGTFPALRIKSLIAIRDTFADTSGTFGFATNRPLQYEFKWLKQGGKIPYLQINAIDVAGNPVVSQISYRDSMRAGVIGIGINENTMYNLQCTIYPNPVHDYLFISYVLDKSENVKIELFDLTGRKTSIVPDKKQNLGEHLEIINLADKKLIRGIYFLRMNVGSKTGNFKIVVQ